MGAISAIIGFVAGIVVMLAVARLAEWLEAQDCKPIRPLNSNGCPQTGPGGAGDKPRPR